MRAHIGSRRERRRTPRTQWLRSALKISRPSIIENILDENKPEILAAIAGSTVNISVTFFNGGIADNLTITVNRKGVQESKSVDFHGGVKSFDNISSNDSIKIDGLCIGHAVVTIDIPLNNNPAPNYPAGSILDFFTVK